MKIAIVENRSDYCAPAEFDRYLVEVAEGVQGVYPHARVIVTGGVGPRITVTNLGDEDEDEVRQSVSDTIAKVWTFGHFCSELTQVERDAADRAGRSAFQYDKSLCDGTFDFVCDPFGENGWNVESALDEIALRLVDRKSDWPRESEGRSELLARFEVAYTRAFHAPVSQGF